MTPSDGRSAPSRAGTASTGLRGAAALLVAGAVAIAACTPTGPLPAATQVVAGQTSAPGSTSPPADGPSPEPLRSPIVPPSLDPGPASPDPVDTPTEIVAGAVDRTSFELSATYVVNAAITVRTGALDVTTRIEVRNDSGGDIDRLELNTIAARLGAIHVYTATVDDRPVQVGIDDQTLVVPLGGVLPEGASATVRIAYQATLRRGVTDSDWMFTRSGGTLALYRWIPWVSRAMPFDRPNDGDPFVTPTSPRVDVELLTDERMILAAPAAKVDGFDAGVGNAWSFSVENVRDVSVVLAPDFRVDSGSAKGIPIRAYTRPGGPSGEQLVKIATRAISSESELLGVDFPWSTLVVVQTPGGVSLESPGLIWIPRGLDTLNRTYAVYHGTAQQWFSGLVGNDQRAEPFADEAPADLLARTVLGTLRSSRCPRDRLDDPIAAYRGSCYYEVVFVQGGLLLDDIRRAMGTTRFWSAMAAYVEVNRYRIGGTKLMLDTLQAWSTKDLSSLLRSRFPGLY